MFISSCILSSALTGGLFWEWKNWAKEAKELSSAQLINVLIPVHRNWNISGHHTLSYFELQPFYQLIIFAHALCMVHTHFNDTNFINGLLVIVSQNHRIQRRINWFYLVKQHCIYFASLQYFEKFVNYCLVNLQFIP